MKSNVDWTICPKCFSLNAAIWEQKGLQSYEVYCGVCHHEYERGRFASDGVRLLVHKMPLPDDEDGLLALTPGEIEQVLKEDYRRLYRWEDWEEI